MSNETPLISEWKKASRTLEEAQEYLSHVGKTGRQTRDHTDVLRISSAHCAAPKFSIAGQYYEGSQNYRDSPDSFNQAMLAVILERFPELSAEAIKKLEVRAAAALVAAEGEIAVLNTTLTQARTTLAAVAGREAG